MSPDTTSEIPHIKPNKQATQTKLTNGTHHRPFFPHVSFTENTQHQVPSHPNQLFDDHLIPFGTPLPIVDRTKILQVCAQNTQHSFHLFGDMIDILTTIDNLKSNGIQMFAPNGPNVNWHNQSNWICTKQLFQPTFQQVHMSAIPSDIGSEPGSANNLLVGGSAILTFGLWASKVHSSSHDLSGYGSYSITKIQGKHNKNQFHSRLYCCP